jgi:threonyl-tRNA synthetase
MNPLHACIINVNSNVIDYCKKIKQKLIENKIRVEYDISDKTLQQKIVVHSNQKIPYLLILGEKEKQTKTLSIRILGSSKSNLIMSIDEFIDKISKKISQKDIKFDL